MANGGNRVHDSGRGGRIECVRTEFASCSRTFDPRSARVASNGHASGAISRLIVIVSVLVPVTCGDGDRAEKAVAVLQQDEPPAEDVLVALEGVQSICDNLDLAQILGKIGGMAPLIRLLGHSDDRVRPMAAETLAISVQNDEMTQNQAADEGALLATVVLVESEVDTLLATDEQAVSASLAAATAAGESAGGDIGLYKALHSLSALVRCSPRLTEAFVNGELASTAADAPIALLRDATPDEAEAAAAAQAMTLTLAPAEDASNAAIRTTIAEHAAEVAAPVAVATTADEAAGASSEVSAPVAAVLRASRGNAGERVKVALLGKARQPVAQAGAAALLTRVLQVSSARCKQRAMMLMQSLLETPHAVRVLQPATFAPLLPAGEKGHGLARLCAKCSDVALINSTDAPYLVCRSLTVAQLMLHLQVESSLSAAYAASALEDADAVASAAGAEAPGDVVNAADVATLCEAAEAVLKHCASLDGEDAPAVEEEVAVARKVTKLARMIHLDR